GCWGMYDRRWCLRAVRQEVGVERNKAEREHRPDHQEVFQNRHHSPHATPSRLSRAKWLRGSFAARDGPFSRAKDEVRAAFPKRAPISPGKSRVRGGFPKAGAKPTLQNKPPPGISPGGPTPIPPRPRRYIRGRKLGHERDSI